MAVTSFDVDDFNQILPQLQEIACPPVVPCTTSVKIDYIFAVDVSGSIGKGSFEQERDWLSGVFKRGDILSTDARVGWTIFDTNVITSDITLKQWSTDELVTYVEGITYTGGATDTGGALKAILTEFSTSGMDSREKVVIMTTDGKPYKNGANQDVCTPYASVMKQAGIRLIVLGVGSDMTPTYVSCLLEDVDTDYMAVTSFDVDDFNQILPQLQEIACPPVVPCTTSVKIDYIFAVDVSGSIGKGSFEQERDWLSGVFKRGDILSTDARVGWTIFDTNVITSDITLKQWSTDELVTYVEGITYTGGATDTGGALKAILTEFSTNGMDSREKVVIMTTDGKPYKNGANQDVCTPYASVMKQAGIRLIVLGVGSDMTPTYVSCLLEDVSTDYIPVTSFDVGDFNQILPQLQDIACPPVAPCTTSAKIDYIFAVDVSGSIGIDAFQQERDWLSGVFGRGDILSSDARVGWTIFDTNVNTSDIVLKEWSTTELVNYVKGIRYTGGWTDTAGALKAILAEYTTNGMDSREKVVVMTTDGKPYVNSQNQDVCTPYASPIKQANIRLIVLGVGSDMTSTYVSCLLQHPDTDYIPVTSFDVDDFNQILPQLQEIACPDEGSSLPTVNPTTKGTTNTPTTTHKPTPPPTYKPTPYPTASMPTPSPTYKPTPLPTYKPTPFPTKSPTMPPIVPCTTSAKIDYIFAVDVSGSIGKDAFEQEREWLSGVFERGDILSSDARVGWTIFDTNVITTDITLKQWTTDELVSYVKAITYTGGATDTAGALNAIVSEFSTNGIDSREKVVIMTTDGKPYKNGATQDVCSPYAWMLQQFGIRLIVLAIGDDITPTYVSCLLEHPDTDYIAVTSFDVDDFNQILPQLQQIACPDEVSSLPTVSPTEGRSNNPTTPEPTNKPTPSPVTTTPTKHGQSKLPTKYPTPPGVIPFISSGKIDYIFAVDVSRSIGEDAFEEEKDWYSDIFEYGEILSSDARIGWVIFDSNVNTSKITLKEWSTDELVSYVKGIRYTGLDTDTAGALEAILAEYLRNGMNSRKKVVIMSTDGEPYKDGEVQDICRYEDVIKQGGIRLIVLAVGDNITPSYVSCLLQHPDTDYIPVASFDEDDLNEIVPQLQALVMDESTSHNTSGDKSNGFVVHAWLVILVAVFLCIVIVLGIWWFKKKSRVHPSERYVTLLDDEGVDATTKDDANL
eukprot:328093_1